MTATERIPLANAGDYRSQPGAAVSSRVHGILNINKPAGMTSHDVVARVRRLTGQRKAGHAGTLDPMATGVLLLCLGQATRVAEYLVRGQKIYCATIHLGVATDTYDAEGVITREAPSLALSQDQIERALDSLRCITEQVPPPYSAVHHGGYRLYQLARRGIAVQPAARPVTIEAIGLISWDSPLLSVEVRCSPGTYVRSLAHDLGQSLGVGGHLAALTRLCSGLWHVGGAITLDELRVAVESGNWTTLLHPLDAALQGFPRLDLPHDEAIRLAAGQMIHLQDAPDAPMARAYAPDGTLRALVQPSDREPGWWQPKKVFSL